MNEDYIVLNSAKLLSLIKNEKAIYKYQMPENMASIFEFSDGKIVLFPAIKTDFGVIFKSMEVLDEVLRHQGIPIEETDQSPFQLEKDNIIDINNSSIELINKFNFDYQQNLYITHDKIILKEVSKQIRTLLNKYDFNTIYEKLYFPIGIYLHMIIKSIVFGNWELEKRYGINPYWIPFIRDEKNISYKAWKGVLDSLEKPKYFELEKCVYLTIIEPVGTTIKF